MARQKRTARRIFYRLLLTLLLSLCAGGVATAQETLWKTYLDAATQAFNEKDYAVAEKRYTLALKEAKNFGAKDARQAITLIQLAWTYAEQDKFDAAKPCYEQAIAIWDNSPSRQLEWVELTDRLGTIYVNKKNYVEAESIFVLGITKLEKAMGTEHPQLISLYNNLGSIYHAQHKYAEAVTAYKRVLTLREKLLGPEHGEVAVSLFLLGKVYEAQSKHAEAEPLYKRALSIVVNSLGAENEVTAIVLAALGSNYAAQKKFAEAEHSYKDALKIKEKEATPVDEIATLLENYAALLREMKRDDEAAKLEARAQTLRVKRSKEFEIKK